MILDTPEKLKHDQYNTRPPRTKIESTNTCQVQNPGGIRTNKHFTGQELQALRIVALIRKLPKPDDHSYAIAE